MKKGKKKTIYVVYGVEIHTTREVSYSFINTFRSEKKADKWYNEKHNELIRKWTDKTIDMYNINYEIITM